MTFERVFKCAFIMSSKGKEIKGGLAGDSRGSKTCFGTADVAVTVVVFEQLDNSGNACNKVKGVVDFEAVLKSIEDQLPPVSQSGSAGQTQQTLDVISHVFHSFQSARRSKYRAATKFCTRHQNATPANFLNLSLNLAVDNCGGSVNMDADGGIEKKGL